MKNWLYVHCGILQTVVYDYELGHSEAHGIIAFIIILFLLASFLLCQRALGPCFWGHCLITVTNRVVEFNIFSLCLYKNRR